MSLQQQNILKWMSFSISNELKDVSTIWVLGTQNVYWK